MQLLNLVGKGPKLLAFFPWFGLGLGIKDLEERRREESGGCLACFVFFLDGYCINHQVRNRTDAGISSCLMVSFNADVGNLKVKV